MTAQVEDAFEAMIRNRIQMARRYEAEWRGFASASKDSAPKILATGYSQSNADNAEVWECILSLYRLMSAMARVTSEVTSVHSAAIEGLRGEFVKIAESARKRDTSQPYIR